MKTKSFGSTFLSIDDFAAAFSQVESDAATREPVKTVQPDDAQPLPDPGLGTSSVPNAAGA